MTQSKHVQMLALVERLRLAAGTARENGTTWVSAHDLTAALDEVERLRTEAMSDNPVRRRLDRRAIEVAAYQRGQIAGMRESTNIPGIDGQVISAAFDLSDKGKENPLWAFIDYEAGDMSFGRWAKCGPNPAPYVRLDVILALTPDTQEVE